MATSPIKDATSATATRDAMFLFDLFRESPTPILIQIGPYAAKTGAKPNTIIKRLAGIKARNGLNINTTLGNYPRPSPGGEPKRKPAKKEEPAPINVHSVPMTKCEGQSYGNGACQPFAAGFTSLNAPLTPTASPSSSASLHSGCTHEYQTPQTPTPVSQPMIQSKRTFDQTELEATDAALDGTIWKRSKEE